MLRAKLMSVAVVCGAVVLSGCIAQPGQGNGQEPDPTTTVKPLDLFGGGGTTPTGTVTLGTFNAKTGVLTAELDGALVEYQYSATTVNVLANLHAFPPNPIGSPRVCEELAGAWNVEVDIDNVATAHGRTGLEGVLDDLLMGDLSGSARSSCSASVVAGPVTNGVAPILSIQPVPGT